MTEITYSGREVIFGTETVQLPDPVWKLVPSDDTVVVLMDTLAKSNYNRNVWAFDRNGDRRWKIEEAGPDQTDGDPYTGFTIKDGQIHCYNWDGHSYRINPDSGEILGREFVK